jgi:hypothetical protein
LLESRIAPAFSAALAGTIATFNGDGADDTLTFTFEGGLLKHNRFTVGDAGFTSDLDFDSTVAGEQTLAASAASAVNILLGAGSDTVILGGDGHASLLLAAFTINNTGANNDVLDINDSAATNPNTIFIANLLVIGTGINTTRTGDAFSQVRVRTGSGDDTVSYTGIEAASYQIETGDGKDATASSGNSSPATIFGGPGDDTLLSGNGADTIFGGDGNDFIDGNIGVDKIFGQTGNDTFNWDPGDGSDQIEGGPGSDLMRFNGANIAENFELLAVGGKLHLTRSIANVTMLIEGTESVELNMVGGADTLEIGNLAATDVRSVSVNLGVVGGGGDGQTDIINVRGSDFDDDLRIRTDGNKVDVIGAAAAVKIVGHEPADELHVFGQLGIDNIVVGPGVSAEMTVFTDGESEDPSFPPALNFAIPAAFDAGKAPAAIAAGRLFGNNTDLVVVNPTTNSISILANNGTTFLPAVQLGTGGKAPKSVVIEDFNNDGHADIAVSNSGSGNVSVFLNDGVGGFSAPTLFATGKTPGLLRAGDLNGDGQIDLAMLTAANTVTILHNDGTGTFATPVKIATGGLVNRDLVLADLSGDGHLDIATANFGSHNVSVLTANPDFTFSAPLRLRTGMKPQALSVGDVDGNGRPDLVVSHGVSRFLSVFLNSSTDAGTSFNAQIKLVYTGRNPSALAVQDIDQDGRADIVVANSGAGTISVLRNLGFATFHPAITFDLDNLPPRKTAGLVLGDFNNDGRIDIASAHTGTGDVTILARIIAGAT